MAETFIDILNYSTASRKSDLSGQFTLGGRTTQMLAPSAAICTAQSMMCLCEYGDNIGVELNRA